MIDARNLVDYASDAAFSVDAEQRVVAWNYGAQRLMGYTRIEGLGRHCSEVLQAILPDGVPLCVPNCEGARCFRTFRTFDAPACSVRHKDSEWVPVSLSTLVMPKQARSLKPHSAVAVVMLRSDRKEESQSLPERPLRIFTFGHFSLVAKGNELSIEKWQRKQAVTLLKFLVAHLGRPVHRETLIEFFWPEIDADRGWKRLKVTVHFLRQQLRAAGIDDNIVETVGKTYALRRDTVWVDSVAFGRCVTEGVKLQRRQQWDKALHSYEEAQHLYRGDYMEEDIYADWCAAEREQLHEIYLEMLAGMADCHAANGRYAEAVQVCRTALVRDPYRESFHRTLMEYLVRLGRADWAMDQYHRCHRLLADELGVEPMHETQRLYRKILERYGGTPVKKLAGRRDE